MSKKFMRKIGAKFVLLGVLAAAALTLSTSGAFAKWTCSYSKGGKVAFCSDDSKKYGDVWRCDKNTDGTWRCGATPRIAQSAAPTTGTRGPNSKGLSNALSRATANQMRGSSGDLTVKPSINPLRGSRVDDTKKLNTTTTTTTTTTTGIKQQPTKTTVPPITGPTIPTEPVRRAR